MKPRRYDDPRTQRKLTHRQRLTQERHDENLRRMMKTPEGRGFIYQLCFGTCHLLLGSFTGNAETYFLEGQRDVGAHVWAHAQRVAPAECVLAHQEAVSANQTEQALRERELEQAAPDAEIDDGGSHPDD